MSKYTLTVFDADGTTVITTKEYSRWINAERAAQMICNACVISYSKGNDTGVDKE